MSNTMSLAIKCPATRCRGHLHPIIAGTTATEVVDRKCRKCGAQWRIVVRPLRAVLGGKGFAHKLDWTCIRGANVETCEEKGAS